MKQQTIRINDVVEVAVGCHLDSHRGQYIVDGMAELFDSLTSVDTNYSADGATDFTAEVAALRVIINGDDSEMEDIHNAFEQLDWLYESLEDKFNQFFTDDRHYWGFNDGEFGLYLKDRFDD